MNKLQKFLFLAIFCLGFLFIAKEVRASEGSFELKNQVGGDTRCAGSSVLMESLDYKILLSCRDLNYPGGERISYYILWANPEAGGNPFRLGEIGLGKAEFQTRTAFSSLFVTREFDKNAGSPTSSIIAQGNMTKLEFLDKPQPAGSPAPATTQPTPKPAPKTSVLSQIFKVTSVVAVVALIGLVIFLFVLVRPK